MENVFQKASADIKAKVGEQQFGSWVKDLVFKEQAGNRVFIAAKDSFTKDWVETYYSHFILEALKKIDPSIEIVTFVEDAILTQPQKKETVAALEKADDGIDQVKSFENFVVGKPNEFAYAAALRVAESKKMVYNPLFLYGGVGLGKTHLMHAIALKIKELHPKKTVLYISAEKFMYKFIKALRFKNMVAFKEEFRNIDVLMIDDVQFFSTKTTTQEEFFHTFNALIDAKKQIILSADKPPTELVNIEDRLKSRMSWGLVADIHPTTYELRLGILQSKAELMHLNISDEVLEFMAANLSDCNVREMEGALNRVAAHADLMGRSLDVASIKTILKGVIKDTDRQMTIDEIKKRVCEYFGVKVKELDSAKRVKSITRARQVAMFLAKELTDKSFPNIGAEFGGKDHTTVLYSVNKVKTYLETDESYKSDVDTLRASLNLRR